MARWIRNCVLPRLTTVNQGSASLAFFMREAFLVGGWTEFATFPVGGNWTSATNVVFTSSNFSVAAANPRQITNTTDSPFTQAMVDNGYVISLRGSTNDQNYSMWRITEFIDADNVLVDDFGFTPYGWVDESSIAGRILDYGSAVHANGDWAEMDAPTGNLRARVKINLANYVECYVQPKAGLGDTTEVPGSNIHQLYDDDDLLMTMNAYFDGNNAFFLKYADNDTTTNFVLFGELEGVPAADTYPGFVLSPGGVTFPSLPWFVRLDMLGPLTTSIRAYTTFLTRSNWGASGGTEGLELEEYYRLINGEPGYVRLRQPQVVLANIASNGGFVRGYLPVMRFGSNQLASYSPIDAAGQWWHFRNGMYIPRNGPNDPQIITSYS